MLHSDPACQHAILPLRDVFDLLGGKWKLSILATLFLTDMRFKALQREIGSITAKTLSKELKDLEMNGLIERKKHETAVPTVEYALTSYGRTLEPVLRELYKWRQAHRQQVFAG